MLIIGKLEDKGCSGLRGCQRLHSRRSLNVYRGQTDETLAGPALPLELRQHRRGRKGQQTVERRGAGPLRVALDHVSVRAAGQGGDSRAHELEQLRAGYELMWRTLREHGPGGSHSAGLWAVWVHHTHTASAPTSLLPQGLGVCPCFDLHVGGRPVELRLCSSTKTLSKDNSSKPTWLPKAKACV